MKAFKQLMNTIEHLHTAHTSVYHAKEGLRKQINKVASFEVEAIKYNAKKDEWFVDVVTDDDTACGLIGNRFLIPLDFIETHLKTHDTVSYDDFHRSIFDKKK